MKMRLAVLLTVLAPACNAGQTGVGVGPFPTLAGSAGSEGRNGSDGVADADHDAIPDRDDACPNDPEDYDGFMDEDGCPDFDHDSHFIADVDDCRFIDECSPDSFIDDDGCPDLVLSFALDSASLDAATLDLLDEIARELVQDSRIVLMRITGRASTGEPPIALQRAAAVRDALMARGVSASVMLLDARLIPDGAPALLTFEAISCSPP